MYIYLEYLNMLSNTLPGKHKQWFDSGFVELKMPNQYSSLRKCVRSDLALRENNSIG